MKKKILSFILSVTVIATTVPVSNLAVYAGNFSNEEEVVPDMEIETESDFTDDGTADIENPSEEETDSEIKSNDDVEDLEEEFYDSENDSELTMESETDDEESQNAEKDITADEQIDAGESQQANSAVYISGEWEYTVSENKVTITGYTGNSPQVVIPSKIKGYVVEKIGEEAFRYCSSLESVTIPDTIKEIESLAFEDCTSLVKVIGGNNLEKIGDLVFWGCTHLESIVLSSSIKECGAIFVGCDNLKTAGPATGDYNVKLGFTETIPNNIFNNSNVVEVTLPDTIKMLGEKTFASCARLKKIKLPSKLESIPAETFYYCESLENITIPDTVKKIEDSAFRGCSSLKSVTIPDAVKEIENLAFEDCTSLVKVIGGNNLEKIGDLVFLGCTHLESIVLSSSIKECGAIFVGCDNLKTAGPETGNYNVKLGFTETIPNNIFNNSNVVEVTLPDTIKTLGEQTFASCARLKKIKLPSKLESIPAETFYYCESLENITIPDTVKKIEDSAFRYCSSLKSVTIPDAVKKIEDLAFEGCSSLESITIPDTVKEIGSWVFEDCVNLTIYGYTGSYAESYAFANNIPFVSIGEVVNVEGYDYSSELNRWILDRGTNNVMNYLVNDANFTNSSAVAKFDNDFGSELSEVLSDMLFRGTSGWKEIFTKSTSKEQAREILIALLEKQNNQIEALAKAEAAQKYASVFVSTFKQANWAYATEFGLNNEEIKFLAALCKKDKIADFLVDGKYGTLSEYLKIGGHFSEDTKVVKCIDAFCKSEKLAKGMSSVVKWGGTLVKFGKMTEGTFKSIYNVESLRNADEMYSEMLAYLKDNCSFVPVSQAAGELQDVIQGGYGDALSYAATSINNTVSDTAIESAISLLAKQIPYGTLINATYHFSVGAANAVFNFGDTQKQRDNMRCVAYIGRYIGKWMSECRSQYLTGNIENKSDNARRTVFAFYMLLKTRIAGEQSLQAMMKLGKITQKRAYAVSMEISETLKSDEEWLKDSGVLSEISTSVVACPVNVEVRNSSGKLILTIYDGKETEGYIENIYYSVFYNPISKDYTKIVRLPMNGGYSLKCVGTDLGVVDYYQTTIADDGSTAQQEVNNIPVKKNSQVLISENAKKQPVCTLKEDNKEIKKYVAKTLSKTYIPVTNIKVDSNKLSLKIGDKQRINTVILPDNASTQGIQWESSAEEIVSVNSDGVVTANKKGSAVITAKAVNDNVSTKIQVTVAEKTTTFSGKFDVKISKATYVYNGKAQKPKITVSYKGKNISSKYYTVSYKNNKNVGTASVTVKGKGNYKKCSGKATFKIILKKITLSGLKTSKNSMTVSWKTISGSSGYQIQYSTSKNFAKAKTKTIKIVGAGKRAATIKKLVSNKTYYVRVRAYKTVNKKNIYGVWSNSKKNVVNKKLTLSSLKAGKKSATINWKTITGSTGYQIQYSTSKNFAKTKTKTIKIAGAGKHSATIKKLVSKKTYYIRIRNYKIVNKKVVYGTWSNSKKTVIR